LFNSAICSRRRSVRSWRRVQHGGENFLQPLGSQQAVLDMLSNEGVQLLHWHAAAGVSLPGIEGPGRHTTMTLGVGEFIRRFLIHVLPKGFHRIRHYGLFASANRAETIARARELLGLATPAAEEAIEIDPAAVQALA